jgi:L-ribulokinase
VAALSEGLDAYKAGQTGLLRLSWDNGDRTVLVNPELGGVTLGWNLVHTAQDELFAASKARRSTRASFWSAWPSTACAIDRVINAGGIPQKNEVLNRSTPTC